MPTTARGLVTPSLTDDVDVPADMAALADSIEAMNNAPLVLGSTLSTTKLTISGATGQVEARAQNATGNVVFAAKRTADTTDLLQILANGTVKVSGGSGSLASAMVPGATGAVDFPNGFTGRRKDSPYFRAYRSTNVLYADGATVVFNSETDPNNWYNTATGVFLPTAAGTYRLSWKVTLAAALTADKQINTFLLNASNTALGSSPPVFQRGTSGILATAGTALAAFNGTTDSAHIVFGTDNGGSIQIDTGVALTHFEAEYVGA